MDIKIKFIKTNLEIPLLNRTLIKKNKTIHLHVQPVLALKTSKKRKKVKWVCSNQYIIYVNYTYKQ